MQQQSGRSQVAPPLRTLESVRGLAVRNLSGPSGVLPNVVLTLLAGDTATERVVPATLRDARRDALVVGELQPATLNPLWEFDEMPAAALDVRVVHVYVWACAAADSANGELLMAQSMRLSRLTYVGDYLPALGVPRDDALIVTLNDGLYMLPHHAIGLHRATIDNDSSVSSTSSALTQPRPPLTVSLDAQMLLRLVELSRSADASIRHAESLAHDAAVSLFGGEALTDVATLDVRSLPLDDAEHSVQARQRAYVLLQTQQQWLTARASELRSRLLEQRAAVAMRNAKVEARRNALLQATVRLSAQRTGVGEGRAVLTLESESLRAVRRAQHKAEARVRMLQWSLAARLLRVFIITTSSDGATLCINALRLPNSDFSSADEESVAAALGSVCHCVSLLSRYLAVPLRYPMRPVGSRSLVTDSISSLHSSAPHFPLYSRGVDRTRFEYAVFLLNKNIEQLLHSQQLEIITLRHTLPNLHRLMLAAKRCSSALVDQSSLNSSTTLSIEAPTALASAEAAPTTTAAAATTVTVNNK
jgi:hypothetical protein